MAFFFYQNKVIRLYSCNNVYKTCKEKIKCMTDVLQKEELDLSGALISMNRMLVILEPVRKKLYKSERCDKNALDLAKIIDVNGEEEFQRVHHMRKLPKLLMAILTQMLK